MGLREGVDALKGEMGEGEMAMKWVDGVTCVSEGEGRGGGGRGKGKRGGGGDPTRVGKKRAIGCLHHVEHASLCGEIVHRRHDAKRPSNTRGNQLDPIKPRRF
jgi:hypothetical protein